MITVDSVEDVEQQMQRIEEAEELHEIQHAPVKIKREISRREREIQRLKEELREAERAAARKWLNGRGRAKGPKMEKGARQIDPEWFRNKKAALMARSDITHVYGLRSQPKSFEQMRRYCAGCQSDRYNQIRGFQERPIDAPVCCDNCWNMGAAILVKKQVFLSIHDRKATERKTLHCYIRR